MVARSPSLSSPPCRVATADARLRPSPEPGSVRLASSGDPALDQQDVTASTGGFGFNTAAWFGQTFTPAVSGQIVVKGEILKVDRDGVYVVRDESGKETMLVTPEVEGKGLHIGDRVTAQVKPDGTVLSLDKQQ